MFRQTPESPIKDFESRKLLFVAKDPAKIGIASGALSLHRPPAILQGFFFRVLHLDLLTAFYAVGFHHWPPFLVLSTLAGLGTFCVDYSTLL